MELEKRKEILLLILNKILENGNQDKIDDIIKFNIERKELISIKNSKLIESN